MKQFDSTQRALTAVPPGNSAALRPWQRSGSGLTALATAAVATGLSN